ncbi:MAG: ribonuclease J, partial [Alphaproteobacteria bacterium]|nr:ribonuclease J [Alphaproteobacteria bacterium]
MRNFPADQALYFVPLGGSEQFGVNLNVYVCNGRLLAVDCGLGFADERFPGIDLLLPDPQSLEDNKARLEALIITHAHEDHIGAVTHLWERLGCPIYTTEFTAKVLIQKFKDANMRRMPTVNVIPPMGQVNLGPFDVQFLRVAHSVPDAAALVIGTPYGRVLHSGDWNLDPTPIMGAITDPDLFRAVGDKGILAYIGDSTNAMVEGRAGSEREVEAGLEAEFRKCKQRIAVTIFSSNIARMIAISRAAQKCGRRVVPVGRSIHRMIGAAIDCGFLKGVPDFASEDDLHNLRDEEVLLLVTGSQGEQRSALAKISRGEF